MPNEIPTGSQSYRNLNPNLFRGSLGKLEASQPKPTPVQTLENRKQKQKDGSCRLEIVVTCCTHRRRLLDDDNNIGSIKPLRDAIANDIGMDDGDTRIQWQYTQVQTRGREGVHVTIERL